MAGLTLVAKLRQTPPRVVLACGWLFLFVYAYPGQMTTDSFDQLAESRRGVYSDAHPPALNLVWKLVEQVVTGPFGMLVLQSVLFLGAMYSLLKRRMPERRAAWIATGLFLFPPVMLPFAAIWKDCLMAALLVLGVLALQDDRRRWRIGALFALMLATAIRYNAFAATFPLVVLLFEWKRGAHWLKRYTLALAAWFVVTLGAFGFNKAITDKEMHFWYSSLAIYDIVGTLNYVEDLPDRELERMLDGTGLLVHDNIHRSIREVFTPTTFMPIINNPRTRLWDLPVYGVVEIPEAKRAALLRAWEEVITTYPTQYARYRLAVMIEVLGVKSVRPPGVVPKRKFSVPEFAYAQAIPTRVSPLQDGLTLLVTGVWRFVPIFLPWIYALLALNLAWRGRRDRLVLALVASGLLTESSLFFLAPSPDYRYSHWLVITACLAFVLHRALDQPWLRAAANTQHSEASQASAQ